MSKKPARQQGELAIIKESELSHVENPVLRGKQLQQIFKHTPKKYVKERPAKGGGKWEYVTGGYVKKCLNLLFGFDWDFQVLNHQYLPDAKQVIVLGQLTCRANGGTIVKNQFGCKDVICKKGTSEPLSLGNDFKAAATDALKKCAAEIGIAADIYNKEEFKAIDVEIEEPNNEQALD